MQIKYGERNKEKKPMNQRKKYNTDFGDRLRNEEQSVANRCLKIRVKCNGHWKFKLVIDITVKITS